MSTYKTYCPGYDIEMISLKQVKNICKTQFSSNLMFKDKIKNIQ